MCSVARLYLTLCKPWSLPGSSVHGILPASILEWVAISYSGDLPNSGLNPRFLSLLHGQVDSLPSEPPGKPVWTEVGDSNSPVAPELVQEGCCMTLNSLGQNWGTAERQCVCGTRKFFSPPVFTGFRSGTPPSSQASR